MRRLIVVGLGVLVLLSAGVVVAENPQPQLGDTVTIDGYAVPFDEIEENKVFKEFGEVADRFGAPTDAFRLRSDGQTDFSVVLTSQPYPAGEASVSGRVIATFADDGKVILADDVDINQPGRDASVDEIGGGAFDGQHISTETNYVRIPFAVDPAGNNIRAQHTLGSLGVRERITEVQPLGRLLQRELGEYNKRSKIRFASELFNFGYQGEIGTFRNRDRRFLVSGEVTVEGVVDTYPTSRVYTTDVRAQTTAIDSQRQIQSNEYVSVNGDYAGVRISAQETILTALPCSGSNAQIPGVGCVPLTTDTVIHTGGVKLADGTIVPVVAASNTFQSQPVRSETGNYRLSGRVINASQLDPRLDGRALLAFDMERVGDVETTGDTYELRQTADRLERFITEQLTSTSSEWTDTVAEAQATPTPTPTPTETATSIGTPTATATMTETTTETEAAVGSSQNGDRGGFFAPYINDNRVPLGLFFSLISALSLLGLVYMASYEVFAKEVGAETVFSQQNAWNVATLGLGALVFAVISFREVYYLYALGVVVIPTAAFLAVVLAVWIIGLDSVME